MSYRYLAFIFVLSGNIVLAHEQTGSLGKSASATDLYQIQCFDNGDGTGNTARLVTQIIDSPPKVAAKLSVQTVKAAKATNTTDAIDGDALGSPFASNYGGDGYYYVIVNKDGAGVESYTLDFHCQSSSGEHTGTEISSLQNQ
ncbi:MAG: hypothetical protein RL637_639 [Pseudomonadota bacterium]|jgi:hypothetical protein